MPQSTINLMVTADHAVPVEPVGGTATVLNQSGDSLFYSDNQQVSAANNQGTLTAGQSAVFTNQAWVRSASLSTVLVTLSSRGTATLTGNPADDTSAIAAGTGAKIAGAVTRKLPPSNGTDDTAAVNAVLALGGRITGFPGQTYLISSPLVLAPGGNTELDMTGCTVAFANTSVACNMLQNYSTAHPVLTVTDASVPLHSNVITSPTLAAVAQVGQVVAFAGAGPNGGGTFVATIPMYGRISAVNTGANTVTLDLTQNTNGIVSHVAIASGGTVQLFNRDSKIRVIGGTWDGGTNWNNLTTRTNAGINSHMMRLRRIDDLVVQGATLTLSGFPLGGGYVFGIAIGDCTNYLIDHCVGAGCSTVFQADGPLGSGLVRNLSGKSMDDFSAAFCVGFSGSDMEGDILGLTIEGLYPISARSAFGGGSGLGSGAAFRVMDGLTIRNVKGSQVATGIGIHLYDYAGSSYVTNLLIEDVDLTMVSAVPPILLNNTAGRNARLRDIKYNLQSVAPVNGVIQIAGYQNVDIDGFAIENIVAGAHVGVLMSSGTVLTKLSLRNFTQTDTGATSLDVIKNTGTTVSKVSIENAHTVSPGNLYRNSAAVTTAVTVRDCNLISGSANFLTSTAGTVTVAGVPSLVSGTATLVAGTSGSIANTNITANSLVRLTSTSAGGTVGALSVTLAAGTGFTINSASGTDTSKVFWEVVQY